ncbi:hypothetical protein R6Q59_006457 [Mikania micrantha]
MRTRYLFSRFQMEGTNLIQRFMRLSFHVKGRALNIFGSTILLWVRYPQSHGFNCLVKFYIFMFLILYSFQGWIKAFALVTVFGAERFLKAMETHNFVMYVI